MPDNKYTQLFIFTGLLIIIGLLIKPYVSVSAAKVILQDKANDFVLEEISSGLGIVWGMAFISKDELIFTQRDGKIGLLNPGQKKHVWLKNLPQVYHNGQGGLLDVAIPADYEKTRWIYFTYSKPVIKKSATTLARAKLDVDNNALINWQDILVTQSLEDGTRHYGSRITFDNTGHIFFSVGDRGNRPNGQNRLTHAGSILRLNRDGSIPDNNPYVNANKALPEIWSYGHRNPQGLFYDKKNNLLWSIEHGPRGGDEINLITPGKNYGWPVISYGKEYWGPVAVGESTHKKGMEQPVKFYMPSIAPGSLMVYSGKAFPQWQGNLFSGALKLKHLNRVVIDTENRAIEEQRLLAQLGERIRCVIESDEGWIYLSTDSGKILRIKPD